MSVLYEMPTTEIYKLIEHPFSSHAMTFLFGLLVLDTIFVFGLYWDKSFENCRTSTDLCYKSLAVFHNITHIILFGFGLFFLYYLVHKGARAHGLRPSAFALVVSFTIFLNLFQWLFRDVFTVMDTSAIALNDPFEVILKKQFFIFTDFFNYANTSTTTLLAIFAAFISK